MNSKSLQIGVGLRNHFPFFEGSQSSLAYLDNAATSQKPSRVIDAVCAQLGRDNANTHRGAYQLSALATTRVDNVRDNVASFIGARSSDEIVFTRGTTESINLVSRAWENQFQSGDVVLLTLLEHHSNIVPWQLLAQRKGVVVKFVEVSPNGTLELERVIEALERYSPKLLSVTQLSNSLGTVVPIQEICRAAQSRGARVLVDAAQAIAHSPIDVQQLGADFLAFSGHKMYGPTGVGVLYAKRDRHAEMDPFLGGGNMIDQVTVNGATWAAPPQKFEAGTLPIAEIVGLGEAIGFIEELGIDVIAEYEDQLLRYAIDQLSNQDGVDVYGPFRDSGKQAGIVSFNLRGVHPHDVATIADQEGVQLRAGHHCAMPTMHHLGLDATVRISFAPYNTKSDIDRLIAAIQRTKKVFGI